MLSPPNLKIVQFHIGNLDNGIISPCFGSDYVDIGGSSTLDPSLLEVKESICGKEPRPAKQGLTILCDSASIRLVSSGYYDNSVTIHIKEATERDMDYRDNLVMVCPGYKM